jgi:hypothetical protein
MLFLMMVLFLVVIEVLWIIGIEQFSIYDMLFCQSESSGLIDRDITSGFGLGTCYKGASNVKRFLDYAGYNDDDTYDPKSPANTNWTVKILCVKENTKVIRIDMKIVCKNGLETCHPATINEFIGKLPSTPSTFYVAFNATFLETALRDTCMLRKGVSFPQRDAGELALPIQLKIAGATRCSSIRGGMCEPTGKLFRYASQTDAANSYYVLKFTSNNRYELNDILQLTIEKRDDADINWKSCVTIDNKIWFAFMTPNFIPNDNPASVQYTHVWCPVQFVTIPSQIATCS